VRRPGQSLGLDGFVWAVGIENTNIGARIKDGGSRLDEYELTQHDRLWREDLDRAAGVGATAIRYGVPWYRANPAEGIYDWTWADQVIAHATGDAGLTLIADLVHYGTPEWLTESFVDPRYPEAIAEFAARFAARYGDRVTHYTPLNEPLVTASFCGQRAIWPPYLAGDEGWARVVVSVADGIQRTIEALRREQSRACIVHVEAAYVVSTEDARLVRAVEETRLRSTLPTDLVLGRVDTSHPGANWLLGNSIGSGELERLRVNAAELDVIGVNYYPELSCRELVSHNGAVHQVAVNGWTAGLEQILRSVHERYDRPLLLSETAVEGDEPLQLAWLEDLDVALAQLRSTGLPILGCTWWPMFDFVDWSIASAGRSIEEFLVRTADETAPALVPSLGSTGDDVASFLRRMGIWRLEPLVDGTLARRPTALVDAFRRVAHGGAATRSTLARPLTERPTAP
jgi:beta-glucosidase